MEERRVDKRVVPDSELVDVLLDEESEVEHPFWDAVNGVAWEGVDVWGIRWPFGCTDLLYALWWRTTPTEMRPSLRGINQAHPDSSTVGLSALRYRIEYYRT
jgi:hypothetical protein